MNKYLRIGLIVGFAISIIICYIIESKYLYNVKYDYYIINSSSKNIEKFLLFTSRSEDLTLILKTGKSLKSMGEQIIQLSAIYGFEKLGYQVIIVNCRQGFEVFNKNIKGYILDYKTLGIVKDLVLTKDSINKVTFFCSWGRSDNEMKKLWSNGNYYLSSKRVLTPYDLGGYTSDGKIIANNTFIGFLPSNILLNLPTNISNSNTNNTNTNTIFESNIKGYYLGKNKYALTYNNSVTIMKYLVSKGHHLYISSSDYDIGSLNNNDLKGIHNLGLLSREDFVTLLKHIKYIIGGGHPVHGTSLVEIFQEEIFLLAPSSQIPYSIRKHPNYISIDNMKNNDVENFIKSVMNGEKIPIKKELEEYSVDSYMNRLCSIYNIMQCQYN